MCAHSSSGLEITEKITAHLYPEISTAFQEVIHHAELMKIVGNEFEMPSVFYELKAEFESLKNYEIKLVFPSVLKMFNTKDTPEKRPTTNIKELQRLTIKKEQLIQNLVSGLKEKVSALEGVHQQEFNVLILLFETKFLESKKEWNGRLNGWNVSCACFLAASNISSSLEKQD